MRMFAKCLSNKLMPPPLTVDPPAKDLFKRPRDSVSDPPPTKTITDPLGK